MSDRLARLARLASEAVEAAVTPEHHQLASSGDRDAWEAILRLDRAQEKMWDACTPAFIAALAEVAQAAYAYHNWTEADPAWLSDVRQRLDDALDAEALAPSLDGEEGAATP